MNSYTLIVIVASILQAITAIFLIAFPDPIRIASLGVFYQVFSLPIIGALLMLIGVVLSVIGLLIPHGNRLRVVFFLLQYFFLLLIAASALTQVLRGHYADGVVRPWQFILLDQLPALLLPILYTNAIIDFKLPKHVKNGKAE